MPAFPPAGTGAAPSRGSSRPPEVPPLPLGSTRSAAVASGGIVSLAAAPGAYSPAKAAAAAAAAAAVVAGGSSFDEASSEIADIDSRLHALQNFLRAAKSSATGAV